MESSKFTFRFATPAHLDVTRKKIAATGETKTGYINRLIRNDNAKAFDKLEKKGANV